MFLRDQVLEVFECRSAQLPDHVVASGSVTTGVLAGLADPRLAKALTAIHEAPKKSLTLGDLATAHDLLLLRSATSAHN